MPDLGTLSDAEVLALLPDLTQREIWTLLMSGGTVVIPTHHATGRPAILIRDVAGWAKLVRLVGQKRAESMALRLLRD